MAPHLHGRALACRCLLALALPHASTAMRAHDVFAVGGGPGPLMPQPIAEAMQLRMPEGVEMSVGFEFECTNKEFSLTVNMPKETFACPDVAFPFDGRTPAKPENMLPEFFSIEQADDEAGELNMARFDAMPQCVRNIVWTKDGFSQNHGKECIVDLMTASNNGECTCTYALEYKTLPMHSAADLREAMVGAALTLKEASRKTDGFQGWNVKQLFKVEPKREKCYGSTHVTKAFIINEESLRDMLKQQMIGFCIRGWPKESAGDKVYRTSFVEAYMLWKAMRHCQGAGDDCQATTTLSDLCESRWPNAAAAQADVEADLFADREDWRAVMGEFLYRSNLGSSAENSTSDQRASLECSPGLMIESACFSGAPDELMLVEGDAEFGFGTPQKGFYYGPGGGHRMDFVETATKVGAMLSADGATLYGLAEHRKDSWNTNGFRKCIYSSLRGARSAPEAEALFDASAFCRDALANATEVDYKKTPSS